MPTTILIVLISILFAIIIALGIWQYFKTKRKQFSNPNYPIVVMVLSAFGGLVLVGSIWPSILNYVITFINSNFDSSIKFQSYNDYSSLSAYVVFCILLGWLGSNHYKYFDRSKLLRKKTNDNNSLARVIDPPKVLYTISSIFEERVYTFFKLRYPNIDILLSEDNNFITGAYKIGNREYIKVIYLVPSDEEREISINLSKKSFYEIKKFLNVNEYGDSLLVDSIVVVENGYYTVGKQLVIPENTARETFVLVEENELLNEFIDFTPYLSNLINDFKNSKLPFSFGEISGKSNLESTYILPSYNNSAGQIDEYVDNWVNQASLEHIALLGQYGTGKTSFVKYYCNKLAHDIISSPDSKFRVPIFISLTSTSPMHTGIDSALKEFIVDSKINITIELFNYIIAQGKFLFLLDGFDEMGFIGTHEQRFYQLNAIWQLAVSGNKMIITGRQSYFPTELEENIALNIKNDSDLIFPQGKPYTSKLVIDFFTDDQIYKSLRSYFNDKKLAKKYYSFILSNNSLHELCRRPSLMHIVREIIPGLINDNSTLNLSGKDLMERYVEHWIDRQLSKNIVSSFNKPNKKEIIIDFYTELSGRVYSDARLNSIVPVSMIKSMCADFYEKHSIDTTEVKEGFETEILTAYFLERLNNEYKFVHKSFYEFFVSRSIVSKLIERETDDDIFKGRIWSNEIIDYVYDDSKISGSGTNTVSDNVPLLLTMTNRKLFAWLKSGLYKSISMYYFSLKNNYAVQLMLFLVLIFVIFNNGLSVRTDLDKFIVDGGFNFTAMIIIAAAPVLLLGFLHYLEAKWVVSIISIIIIIINLWISSLSVTITLSFILLYYVNVLFVRFLRLIENHKSRLGIIMFFVSFLVTLTSTTLAFHFHSMNLYSILAMLVFYGFIIGGSFMWQQLNIFASIDDDLVDYLPLDFITSAFYISLRKNIVYKEYPLYLLHFNNNANIQHVHNIRESQIVEKLSSVELEKINIYDTTIESLSMNFDRCIMENVVIKGSPISINFESCKMKNVHFDLKIKSKWKFSISFDKMSIDDVDDATIENIKNLIQDNSDMDCYKFIPDWLKEKFAEHSSHDKPPVVL